MYTGRRQIFTDVSEITYDNVTDVLRKALNVHETNASQTDYLYKYYCGDQPILRRVKTVESNNINNKIVVNRANEIVSFKTGYLIGEPIQYVNRGDDESQSEFINLLNEYINDIDKHSDDKELVDWMHICGTGYRMIMPSVMEDEDSSPFEMFTLDPRNTFVVYSSGLGHKPMMGVRYVTLDDGRRIFAIYTENKYFEYSEQTNLVEQSHTLGIIPIVEYPLNKARLGSFEVVIPMLDAINTVASNRVDGVEQFIQALLMFKGVDIDSEDFQKLKELGGIKVPADGNVEYITQELNQTQTQTLVDDMWSTVLEIVGMPSVGTGDTSDSSNNGAVILKNGWQEAEARAKNTELVFKKSEKVILKIAIRLMNTFKGTGLKRTSIDIRFTRRNYENIYQKAQVLMLLLGSDMVHPRLAFEHCGLFADPEIAYTSSMQYKEEKTKEMEESLIQSPVVIEEETEDV